MKTTGGVPEANRKRGLAVFRVSPRRRTTPGGHHAQDHQLDVISPSTKYVASTTLTDPECNNTEVLRGDLVEEVTKLKPAEGRDILMYGYGLVTHTLLKAGLVDEVRSWIHPLLQGGTSVSSPLGDAQTRSPGPPEVRAEQGCRSSCRSSASEQSNIRVRPVNKRPKWETAGV